MKPAEGNPMTVRVTDKSNGAVLGTISKEDLHFLIEQLEEESSQDNDYFIDQTTVDILEEAGGSASLVAMLRAAVGSSDGIDIAWESV
jgi:hypothetical protein